MKSILLIGVAALSLAAAALAVDEPAIIPQPQKMERQEGVFKLSSDTRIFTDYASVDTGEQLATRLRQATGYPLKTRRELFSGAPQANRIMLTTKKAGPELGAEGYELDGRHERRRNPRADAGGFVLRRADAAAIAAAGNIFVQPGGQLRTGRFRAFKSRTGPVSAGAV